MNGTEWAGNSIQVTHFSIETLQSNDFSTPLKCKNTFLKNIFSKILFEALPSEKQLINVNPMGGGRGRRAILSNMVN
jgi:hypothetical protein